MNIPLFYKKKPILGIDIGHNSVKAVQLQKSSRNKTSVVGYGYTKFDESAVKDGKLIDYESLAKAIHPLLTELIVGGVTTNRVGLALPSSKTFARVLTLPDMSEEDLEEAVRLEAEQYIPKPLEEIYIDYEVRKINPSGKKSDEGNKPELEVMMVAAPRDLVKSYLDLFDLLGLEVEFMETTLASNVRAVTHAHPPEKATLIADFGSRSSDLSIYDANTIRVTGTTNHGGESVTDALVKGMNLTPRQAYAIKSRYGLKKSKYKKDIDKLLKPMLDELVSEIKKMMHYYSTRAKEGEKIDELMLVGGGANLPGIDTLLKKETKLNVSVCNPWDNIDFSNLQKPHPIETTLYTTSLGLAFMGVADGN